MIGTRITSTDDLCIEILKKQICHYKVCSVMIGKQQALSMITESKYSTDEGLGS